MTYPPTCVCPPPIEKETKMTPLELADELDNANFDNAMYLCDQAATMLRQQQSEIEELKYQLKITRTVLKKEQEK